MNNATPHLSDPATIADLAPVALPPLTPGLVIDLRAELLAQVIDTSPEGTPKEERFPDLPPAAEDLDIRAWQTGMANDRWWAVNADLPAEDLDADTAVRVAGALLKAAGQVQILNAPVALSVAPGWSRQVGLFTPIALVLMVTDVDQWITAAAPDWPADAVTEFEGDTYYPLGTFQVVGSEVRDGRTRAIIVPVTA